MSGDYVFAERLRKDSFINLRRFLSLIVIWIVSLASYPFVASTNMNTLVYINVAVCFASFAVAGASASATIKYRIQRYSSDAEEFYGRGRFFTRFLIKEFL